MRVPFTTQDAYRQGMTLSSLRHAVQVGDIQRVHRGVYVAGLELPTPLERAAAVVIATKGVASGALAGALYDLDSVILLPPFATIDPDRKAAHRKVRRSTVAELEVTRVQGIACTAGLQTVLELAGSLDDLVWEQALESALRKKLFTIEELLDAIEVEGGRRTPGVTRMRRVLDLRPLSAPPTESLLETLMVQLIRTEPRLAEVSRQVEVHDAWDKFVARVDLAWPNLGVFIELDGQQHKGQPLYDASRETAVVATTGWLPGRFTWHEVVYTPRTTLRRLLQIHEQAALRAEVPAFEEPFAS